MARKMDVDWSDWDGKCKMPPAHPLSKPLSKSVKNGADAINSTFADMAASIIRDAPKQPTDEQMFGHLVVSESMAKAAEEKWNSTFDTLSFKGPVDHLNKSPIDGEWGVGKSFNQLLKGKLTD